MTYKHNCKNCGKKFLGRKNKIFCEVSCKAAFNNKLAADFRAELVDNHRMENAYIILKDFHNRFPGNKPVLYEDLLEAGMSEYAPSRILYTSINNFEYRIIHGYGYRFVDDTKKLVVINSKEEILSL